MTPTHWVISIGGVTREFDATIVVQHPDQRLAWNSTDGTTHSGVVSFERPYDTHTRVLHRPWVCGAGSARQAALHHADNVGLADTELGSNHRDRHALSCPGTTRPHPV